MGRQAYPSSALVTSVTVQVTTSASGVCWDASFSGTALQNDLQKFVALSDP
jgi:hypothetical protein